MLFKLIAPLAALLTVSLCQKPATLLEGEYGIFQSPGFPEPYPNNLNEAWTIECDPGFYIELDFINFYLEESYDESLGGACVYDYLKITELGDEEGNGTRFCGSQNGAFAPWNRYLSKSTKLIITMVTDYSNDLPDLWGFQVAYKIKDIDECKLMHQGNFNPDHLNWDEITACSQHCLNTASSYRCLCKPNFVLHEDQHTCILENQTEVLKDDSGSIRTWGYPQLQYTKYANRKWSIQVRQGLSVNLLFERHFEIEEYEEGECAYDKLIIKYEGFEEEYCGVESPFNGDIHATNVRSVELSFVSDRTIEYSGFSCNYTTTKIRCNKPLPIPNNGEIIQSSIKNLFEFEDQVEYRCDVGYKMKGSNFVTCKWDGEWSELEATCPDVDECLNDELCDQVCTNTIGSYVCSCNVGWTLDQNRHTCSIVSCGKPIQLLEVKNLQVLPNDAKYVYNETLSVECQTNYLMSGAAKWRCSENGNWIETETDTGLDGAKLPVCTPKCGWRRKGPIAQIGGTAFPVEKYDFAWHAHIFRRDNRNKHCGGALLNRRFLLTAHHCQKHLPIAQTEVHFGIRDKSVTDGDGVQKANGKTWHAYSRFDSNHGYLLNDFALLELDRDIEMTDHVHPICLPTAQQTRKFQMDLKNQETHGRLSGFGNTEHGSTESSLILMYGDSVTLNRKNCGARLKQEFFPDSELPSYLVSPLDLQQFACHQIAYSLEGDSGGSYVINKPTTEAEFHYITFAVVSWGPPFENFSVSSVIDHEDLSWINKVIN